MFAGRVAPHWLEAVVTRASSSSSSSLLPLEPFIALCAGFQKLRCSLVHVPSRCLSGITDSGSSSSTADTPPTSSTAGDSSASAAAQAAGTQQQKQRSSQATPARFLTVPKRFSVTGYPETSLQPTAAQQQPQSGAAGDRDSNDASSGSDSSSSTEQQQRWLQRGEPLFGGVELPPELLRVPLTQAAKQEQAEVTVDAYSLSRSLVGEAAPGSPQPGAPAAAAAAAAEQQAGREALTAADREALEKLVGILTKDGKKGRARRLLLDAMHVIQQQLAQGKGGA